MIQSTGSLQQPAVTAATISKAATPPNPKESSFHDLFTMASSTAEPKKQAAASMTKPVFEQTAFVKNQDGSTTPLNPMEMAADSTAQEIAKKLGGTVMEEKWSGVSTSAPIRDIVVPGSSAHINAGIAATLFAMYGDEPGGQAWKIINRDLGKTNV